MPKESDNNFDALALLRWVAETFKEEIAPFQAITDLHLQIATYHCWGCDGEFESRWPRWEEPTLETFPHKPDCRYTALVRLARIEDEHVSK